MPPNLGGFFMVRSYYPSECHADYFDFERIEALKPAIEACGISTLSQSPMLGFHKQMDNRITAISIFVCLSMVQLMAVFISMRCTLCGHFLQVALTLILVVGYAIAAS